MGVDAVMVVKIKADKPSNKQLKDWSFALCASLGAKHFFVQDGLPYEEYVVASNAWRKAFKAHAQYPIWRDEKHPRRNEARLAIIKDIGEARRRRQFAVDLVCSEEGAPGKVFDQDTPLVAADDEWLLEINLMARYYGEGYERGDILTICAVAEWCEANLPNAEVWYGGDSRDIEPFPTSRQVALRRHLYSQKGREYFECGLDSVKAPKPCGLCRTESGEFTQYSWGPGNGRRVVCRGCGKHFQTEDGGVSWVEFEERNNG